MKKILSLVLALILVLSLAACGNKNASSNDGQTSQPAAGQTDGDKAPLNVGLIAEGFGTQSFCDDVKMGVDRAIQDLGIQGTAVEVPDVAEVSNSLRTLIAQGCNLLVVPSSQYLDAMVEVAKDYSDVKFVYLETADVEMDNVMSISYRENEAAFLAGALGGMMTKSNVIGTVLAVNEPVQQRYASGFTAGAKTVNPDCEVRTVFTNSYSDINAGHDAAEAMYKQSADYVGCYAGACNLGVFNAASEAGEGKYAFGAATGQFDKMPDKIVASVVKPIDTAIYNVLKEYHETGVFHSGVQVFGIAFGGVELRYTTENDALLEMIPDAVKAKLEELTEKIISGELKVPANEEELNAYTFSSPLDK